jgi:hypothetical protein
MRYGLLFAAVLSAGCGIFGDGDCDPVTGDCSRTSFCCSAPLFVRCEKMATFQTIFLEVDVRGGRRPYAYAADWGHGELENGPVPAEGSIRLVHTFPSQAEPRSFTVRVTATDANDDTAACAVTQDVPGTTAPGG